MSDKDQELAWRILAYTDTHLFLTGRAGTGKTTFLRELRHSLPKRMVVLAPTGIAAINAHGTTIHSFFQIPFGPNIPCSPQNKDRRFMFRKHKRRLIRSLDLIVIDEISMVRADVLDAIDRVLRMYRDRDKPFGGVQMLMIGDMQQLPPVTKGEEWRILSAYYQTPYFFSSEVLRNVEFVTVELTRVYRQEDPLFLDILNKVRVNNIDEETLSILNQRYIPDFMPDCDDGYIYITTHNRQADEINAKRLEALPTSVRLFKAVTTGDFPESSYPTEETLSLKIGTQVMFVKNDSSFSKEYYNGMIGEIIEFEDNIIRVRATDNDTIIDVREEKWENIKYSLDEKTSEVTEEVTGTFSQYPLKMAWAITVHKSQGLTFNKAVIDVHQSFSHGQTYVALSRCKTMEGLVLSAPIPFRAIISDMQVVQFLNDPHHQQPDEAAFNRMQQHYMLRMVEELFDFNILRNSFTDIQKCISEHFYSSHPNTHAMWMEASGKLEKTENVAVRFRHQYSRLIFTLLDYKDNPLLQERLRKGADYFIEEISFIVVLLRKTNLPTSNKQLKEHIVSLLQSIYNTCKMKIYLLRYVAKEGFDMQKYLKEKTRILLDIDNGEKTFTDLY